LFECETYHKHVCNNLSNGSQIVKCKHIKPIDAYRILTWEELETLICSVPDFSVPAMREKTIYESCSAGDPFIEILWRVLESFDKKEKSLFLRFVYGQSRLPATARFTVCPVDTTNPNQSLPQAMTCSFKLKCPRYTTYEDARNKILFAINHCTAIDSDFAAAVSDVRRSWDEGANAEEDDEI